MRRYETVIVVNPDLAPEQHTEAVERYQGIIAAQGGDILQLENWGQKTLAYPVAKHTRAYYTMYDYCGEAGTVKELERNLRIDERVIKFLTVKTADEADPQKIKDELRKKEEARRAEAAAREAERAAAEAAARQRAEEAEAQAAAQAAAPEPTPEEAPMEKAPEIPPKADETGKQ